MKVKILSNEKIAQDVYKMRLRGVKNAKVGQFLQIQTPGFFLRRPISISEIDGDTVSIIYKTFGKGTLALTNLHDELDVLEPFGNGFELEELQEVLLIGGGVGVPPLYELAKQYKKKGADVNVVLGFNTKSDMFYEDEFKALGCKCFVATMDGSYGQKGTVIDVVDENDFSKIFAYACGPLPMLRAVDKKFSRGFISLEARMACGIGVCMSCVVKSKSDEALRVCTEGPVFKIGEVEL